jgi:hypothetical protein
MSFEPIADRVRRGAVLLDRVKPGWWREIATDRLVMNLCDTCILGQLYGGYVGGLWILAHPLSADQGVTSAAYGFTLTLAEQFKRFAPEAQWEELAHRWRAEIAVRAATEGERA